MKTAIDIAFDWLTDTDLRWNQNDIETLAEVINDVRKEQDKITRHACAEAVLEHGDTDPLCVIACCHNACMNVKAV